MTENTLPEFQSPEQLAKFFDTHDMGEYDLPEAHFDVDLQKRTSRETRSSALKTTESSGPWKAKIFVLRATYSSHVNWSR